MSSVTALFNRLASGVRALLSKTRVERELDAELREYLNAAIEQKMSSGMSRADATRAARADMGSVEAVKDHVRDAGWESTVESVWRDADALRGSLFRFRAQGWLMGLRAL